MNSLPPADDSAAPEPAPPEPSLPGTPQVSAATPVLPSGYTGMAAYLVSPYYQRWVQPLVTDPDQPRVTAFIVAAALVVSIVLELMHTGNAGINVVIVTLVVVAAMLVLEVTLQMRRSDRAWLAGVLIFALPFAFRDSPALLTLDAVTMIALALAATLRRVDGSPWAMTVAKAGERAGLAVAGSMVGGIYALSDAPWRQMRQVLPQRRGREIALGVVIALPALLVFAALFANADAQFRRVIELLLPNSINTIIGHIVLVCVWTYIATGVLRDVFELKRVPNPALAVAVAAGAEGASQGPMPRPMPLPATRMRRSIPEASLVIALGMIDLLFLLFVVLQLPTLFGGHHLVVKVQGLTYAEYAHHGFVELAVVAGLVLVLIVAADYLRDQAHPRHRLFTVSGGVLVALTLVVVASAYQRMNIYTDTFGLTELRFYGMSWLGWVALSLVAAFGTVVRGHSRLFLTGSFLAAVAVMAVINVMNPDAYIARRNIDHAQSVGAAFDARYGTSLSADAAPTLVNNINRISNDRDRYFVAHSLLGLGDKLKGGDWREANLARTRAREAIDHNRGKLTQLARPIAVTSSTPSR